MKKNSSHYASTALLKKSPSELWAETKDDKYRTIIENATPAFFLTVPDGRILESNRAASTIFGYTTEEFKQLKKWHLIDYKDKNLLNAVKEMEITNCARTDATGIKKNGIRFLIEISAANFTDSNGEIRSSILVTDLSNRKKAEKALQLSNERYDLVVKATKDLVWDWDLATDEIYRSGNSLTDVYGHSSNKLIHNIQNWSDYLHPLDKEKIKFQIDYYIHSAEETAFDFEYRFQKEDGTYNFINDRGYILRNEQGKAIRMIGAARNITEQKNASLALAESEQRYKMFIKQSTEGIWRIELNGKIEISDTIEEMVEECFTNAFIAECNDAYAQMYGFEKATDLIGIPLHKLWPKDNVQSIEYITNFFKNGFKATEEITYEYNKNGQEVIFINTMVGIIEGNNLNCVWGIRSDITKQKKSEQDLIKSENHLRAIVQTDPECIKILNKKGIILEMNPAGLALIEADHADQVIGKEVLELVLPPYKKAYYQAIKDVFNGKSVKLDFEIKGFKGNQRFMESHCVPLKNGTGDIIALLSVTRDITEKIQLENSLNEAREIRHQQITEAVITGQEKERTEIGEELHDNINQILASSKLYIECAMKDLNPRKELMAESKLLLEKAMKELRKLSKSLLPPSLGEIGLQQALKELVENINNINGLVISIDWKIKDENKICDKLKLTIFRIAQEQLNNVIKHAGAKTTLVGVYESDREIKIIVKDDGHGFNTSVKRNGVGLRNIGSRAEVNNGTVSITSNPGDGCELAVIFPKTDTHRDIER